MHSPRPVSAESTLRGRTARALYHIPAGMCQKTPIRTDREGERTRIRTGGTINTSMPQHRNAKPAPSPAEQVRLPLQWCVYFRALRVSYRGQSREAPTKWQSRGITKKAPTGTPHGTPVKPSATRESSFTLDSTQRDLEQRRQGLPGGSRNQREEDTGNGPSEVPPLHGKLRRHPPVLDGRNGMQTTTATRNPAKSDVPAYSMTS